MSSHFSCNIARKIDPTQIRKALEIGATAFSDNQINSPQIQSCYTEKTFKHALEDQEYIKIMAIDNRTQNIVGIMLLTNNLKKAEITHTSAQFLENTFRNQRETQSLYYITLFAVTPSRRQEAVGRAMIREGFKFFDKMDNPNIKFAFDYCETKGWLPEMIMEEYVALQEENQLKNISITLRALGSQKFAGLC